MKQDNNLYGVSQNNKDEECWNFLFDNKVKVWLPGGFYDNSELIEKRYPYKKKPSIIKVDRTGKVYPYNDKMILKRFKTNQGIPGISFSFYSMMNFSRQFIELFVLSIHGQLFIGTATCPEKNKNEWNSAFLKMKRTVQEIEQNDNRKGVFI